MGRSKKQSCVVGGVIVCVYHYNCPMRDNVAQSYCPKTVNLMIRLHTLRLGLLSLKFHVDILPRRQPYVCINVDHLKSTYCPIICVLKGKTLRYKHVGMWWHVYFWFGTGLKLNGSKISER